MAEPGTKLRPGVRLSPGGHVILLPTRIMAIMELAEMAHCRHQCSAWVICQVGSDVPEKQAGEQAASLTLLEWKDGGEPLIFFSEFMKMAPSG